MELQMDNRSDLDIIEEDEKETTQVLSNLGNSVKRKSMDTPDTKIITNPEVMAEHKPRENTENLDIISQPMDEKTQSEGVSYSLKILFCVQILHI